MNLTLMKIQIIMKALSLLEKYIKVIKMEFVRESGILLNISSLPSKYGIGSLGEESYKFIDFLSKSKCKIWQILPLNVTSYGDSPYQSPSNYGLNYYYIDIDILIRKKLLHIEEVESVDFGQNETRVNYSKLFNQRLKILKKAFSRFNVSDKGFINFSENNAHFRDFALFMVIKELNGLKPWIERDRQYRIYSNDLEIKVIKENTDLFNFYLRTQFEFLNQFNDLKKYAASKGVKIMGDLPIYVAYDSVEVWKYPELFQLNSDGYPTNVAGCPPDCFSSDGQLRGNPLYNWDYHKFTNYKWWNERINNCLKLFDYLRIDHFRGFSGFYSIPFGDKTAKNGHWETGPGFDLFKDKLNLPIIAEDLGMMDEAFYNFFQKCGYPGMKIVTQCFDSIDENNIWRPSNYTENYFSYTATHDSPTTKQFLDDLDEKQFELIIEILKDECKKLKVEFSETADKRLITLKICECNFASHSRTAIVPLQDLLVIGEEGRMNYPSKLSTLNWSRRVNKKEFDTQLNQISEMLVKRNLRFNRT